MRKWWIELRDLRVTVSFRGMPLIPSRRRVSRLGGIIGADYRWLCILVQTQMVYCGQDITVEVPNV